MSHASRIAAQLAMADDDEDEQEDEEKDSQPEAGGPGVIGP